MRRWCLRKWLPMKIKCDRGVLCDGPRSETGGADPCHAEMVTDG